MSARTLANTLTRTVEELARPESYKDLYHEHNDGVPLPSGEILQKIVDLARGIIFPGYYGRSCIDTNTLKYHLGVDTEQLYSLLVTQIQAGLSFSNFEQGTAVFAAYSPHTINAEMRRMSEERAEKFLSRLPELRRVLATDVVAAFNGDPAAKNYAEIISFQRHILTHISRSGITRCDKQFLNFRALCYLPSQGVLSAATTK